MSIFYEIEFAKYILPYPNFLSYIRRAARDYENSKLSCHPEQQIYHLREKIKRRYRNTKRR